MPTFTRAALAPALKDYVRQHPDVTLRIVEGYSGLLTDMVLAEELDFAVVPGFEGRTGLKSRLLARDREMLLSGKARGLKPLKPVRLANFPTAQARGAGPDRTCGGAISIPTSQTNGIAVAELIEMDAMTGTLEFVAASDWVTVLPSLICINDIAAGRHRRQPDRSAAPRRVHRDRAGTARAQRAGAPFPRTAASGSGAHPRRVARQAQGTALADPHPRPVLLSRVEHRLQRGDGVHDTGIVDLELALP